MEHLKQISQLAKQKSNKNGRPSKEKDVIIWRMQHPLGTKAECIRETGISKKTVYKYWAAAQSNETLDQSCLSASVISKKLGNSR